MPSPGGRRFESVPSINNPRSQFDFSHGVKTTFDADYLIPVLVQEVYPGDGHNVRFSGFGRLATPYKPVMDNMTVRVEFFYAPNRLVWPNFEKMCGAQANPGDSIAYTTPIVDQIAGGPEIHSLSDYFGIPVDQTDAFTVNALPFRIHNLIHNTWYRSEDLQNSVVVDLDDGPDVLTDYVVRKRGKRKDYFTSCLPAPQRGSAVSLPLTGNATVMRTATAANGWKAYLAGTDTLATDGTAVSISTTGQITAGSVLSLDPRGGLYADLSTVTATTINALRLAEATQELLEIDARGGTRQVEINKNHFGVTTPDFRLNRPEFLGSGVTNVSIHPVPLTAKGDGTSAGAQGNLAGFGTFSFSGIGFSKSFVEHGFIIGYISVVGDQTYSQGLDRMWSNSTRYSYLWPSLAHIGEQAVYLKEIYNNVAEGTTAGLRSSVFGYQEQYGHLRYKPSRLTGLMAPAVSGALTNETVSEKFTSYPSLDSTFILSNTDVDRVIVVTSEPHFKFDGWFDYKCARVLPIYGVPSLAGRL